LVWSVITVVGYLSVVQLWCTPAYNFFRVGFRLGTGYEVTIVLPVLIFIKSHPFYKAFLRITVLLIRVRTQL